MYGQLNEQNANDTEKEKQGISVVPAEAARPVGSSESVSGPKGPKPGTCTTAEEGVFVGASRMRAVRLLREAACRASLVSRFSRSGATLPVGLVGPSSSNSNIDSNICGELAFVGEKAAMEAFGAGSNRYFESIVRLSWMLKV